MTPLHAACFTHTPHQVCGRQRSADRVDCSGATRGIGGTRGSVVIEFILVTPLFLVVLGYTFRLTQLLQAHQIAMTFSREAATEAFRRCTDISILRDPSECGPGSEICINETATALASNVCLAAIKAKYESQWDIAKPSGSSGQATIDLGVYRYDLANLVIPANCLGASGTITRFMTNTSLPDPPISSESLCTRNRVARARISFTLAPTKAFLDLLPGGVQTNFTVEDETIL